MKFLVSSRVIAATALGCALFAAGPAAQADVYFSAGVPIYSQPAPVYVQPQPAVVAPYGPEYVTPGYAWEQRQEWRRRYWEHRRWEHRRWEQRRWERWQWERRHHRDREDDDD